MKKNLTILIAGLLLSLNLPAQGFLNTLNKAINGLGQRGQQMNNQRNNNQRTYQNYQRNDSQERLYQQRRETQQRSNYQRKNNDTEIVEPSNSVNLSNVSNQAQENDKVVTLVTSGTGNTKEEAIRNALRSAIEQAFGTFVSANTEVLNDDLIKDEVTTVSTGNIRSYKELSVNQSNGTYDVSVQAIVSIDQLTNYAKSKGFQVELAGAEFVMNMKMRELNKQNELAAIDHLQKKLQAIAQNGLFTYELEKNEPVLINNSQYGVKLKLVLKGNANTKAFYDEIYKTIGALNLTKSEAKEYDRIGLDYYVYDKQLKRNKDDSRIFERWGNDVYALRNNYPKLYECVGHDVQTEISWLMPILIEKALNFVIHDNLGNEFYCDSNIKYEGNTCVWHYCDKEWYLDEGNEKYFYLKPANRLSLVKRNEFIRTKRTGDVVIGIPLQNWGTLHNWGTEKKLSFNPMVVENDSYLMTVSKETKDRIQNRIQNNCYFQMEFFVLYSEDELLKVNSFSIDYRNTNFENIKEVEQVQERTNDNPAILLENDSQQTDLERRAEFPGGEYEMLKCIRQFVRYPVVAEENGIQGDVIVQFDIERDGSVVDAKVVKSIDVSLDNEALRVVRKMPKWSPAIKDGVAVRSHRVISIPFRLQ